MEKTTDFAKYLQSFFINYMALERGASQHTIRAYRDTFILLLEYLNKDCKISVENLKMNHITKDIVLGFLNWLQDARNCSVSTRNLRFAAIRSFFVYMQYEDPTRILQWQLISSIKVKKTIKPSVNHLTIEGITCLLEQVQTDNRMGHRDLTLLSILYNSGARVQELISLTPSSIRLYKPYLIELYGKGCKKRLVPLDETQISLLESYIIEFGLDKPGMDKHPLFYNCWGEKLTNPGVTYILLKYAAMARIAHPGLIPSKISPHTLRHSKAMHLLQAGVNLVYIRDILGHVSIQTTEIYARADSKSKREALEKAYINVINTNVKEPSWEKNSKLKEFLKGLS